MKYSLRIFEAEDQKFVAVLCYLARSVPQVVVGNVQLLRALASTVMPGVYAIFTGSCHIELRRVASLRSAIN